MICTLVRLDTGLAFVPSATLVTNSDGSVSFQAPGGWAGQEPNLYGQRHPDQPVSKTPGPYQRAQKNGNIVTFLTRPGDLPCSYLYAEGQVFPS